MRTFRRFRLLFLALAVLMVTVPVFLFYRFRQNDTQTFSDFTNSYEQFDTANAVIRPGEIDDTALDQQVDTALLALTAKANSFRLSSLVEHDGELMDDARQIAKLAQRELASLGTYKRALQTKRPDANLSRENHEALESERKAAYAHFRQLAGLED